MSRILKIVVVLALLSNKCSLIKLSKSLKTIHNSKIIAYLNNSNYLFIFSEFSLCKFISSP
jgi:hypothetical protein